MNSAIAGQAKKAPTWLKIVVVAAVGLVAAPFVVLTIKGLVGMMIAAGIAFFGIVFLPILMDWFVLLGQKASKAAVEANPIEKLELLYAEKKEGLRTFYVGLQDFIGKVNGFQSQHAEMVRKYPHRKAELDDRLATLLRMKKTKMDNYRQAEEILRITGLKVEEARDIYKLAQAAAAAELAGGAAADPMNEVMEKVAFDSVTNEVNRAFAALEMEDLQHDPFSQARDVTPAPTALPHLDPVMIEAKPTSKSFERVK